MTSKTRPPQLIPKAVARCPWCLKTPDQHSWGPMRDGCDFRFVHEGTLPRQNAVLLLWRRQKRHDRTEERDELLHIVHASMPGYMRVLRLIESDITRQTKYDDTLWQIKMRCDGMPAATNDDHGDAYWVEFRELTLKAE